MNGKNLYLTPFMLLLVILNMACSNDESDPENGSFIRQGRLYYTSADELVRYDFESKSIVTLFSAGDHYRVSPDADRFLWYKNNFSDGTTRVQVHSLSNPSEYELVVLPYILEQTPWFISGSDNHYVGLARAADGAVKRQDLVLFSNDNSAIGRIPHVKAFAILPNGNDLIISAEAFGASGASVGFALAVIRNFRSADGQENFTIREYLDYSQLPEDIAVSPKGDQIVFTHLDHLYTVGIQEEATPRQITQSRFREVDAAWSKDGEFIVFTATPNPSLDCGEVRIIPAHPQSPVPIPEDGVDNEPVEALQPVNAVGKTISACGSESYLWL